MFNISILKESILVVGVPPAVMLTRALISWVIVLQEKDWRLGMVSANDTL